MPREGRFVKRRVPVTTNNITKAIINYLLSEGHSASRVNVQGQYDDKLRVWRKSGARKGVLDIIGCIKPDGRFIAIDVKVGDDKLSPEQSEFIMEIRRAGGIAFDVSSYKDFLFYYDHFVIQKCKL